MLARWWFSRRRRSTPRIPWKIFEARIHAVEHQVYVEAIRRVLGLSAVKS